MMSSHLIRIIFGGSAATTDEMRAQPDRDGDEDATAPAAEAELSEISRRLQAAIDRLPDRERRILALRYGIYDGVARTLEEIAEEFNLTRERIRQLESLALCRLRHPSSGIRE